MTYDLTADGSAYLINSLDQIDPAVIAALATGGALYWLKTDSTGAIVASGGTGTGTPYFDGTGEEGIPVYAFPVSVSECAIFAVENSNSLPGPLGVNPIEYAIPGDAIALEGWNVGALISVVVFGS